MSHLQWLRLNIFSPFLLTPADPALHPEPSHCGRASLQKIQAAGAANLFSYTFSTSLFLIHFVLFWNYLSPNLRAQSLVKNHYFQCQMETGHKSKVNIGRLLRILKKDKPRGDLGSLARVGRWKADVLKGHSEMHWKINTAQNALSLVSDSVSFLHSQEMGKSTPRSVLLIPCSARKLSSGNPEAWAG